MDPIFHRPQLALDMAQLLLRPSSLETRFRSGLFISAPRQTGKSTFLVQDLIPTLESAGAIVIYVDLWEAKGKTPEQKLLRAVQNKLTELQGADPRSFAAKAAALLRKTGFSSAEVEAAIEPSAHLAKAKIGGKIKLGFDTSTVGEDGEDILHALLDVSKKTGRDIVFIVDEVQDLMRDDGLMKELKATRDAINMQHGDHGYFLFVGTGSNRSMVHEMTAQRRAPFYGAQNLPFPTLGKDYVKHALAIQRHENAKVILPSESAAHSGMRVLGNKPNLFQQALSILQRSKEVDGNPDVAFEGIVNAMYDQEGNVEFERLKMLGALPQVVFARICQGPPEGVTGLYADDARAEYAKALGWDGVTKREVQLALAAMTASGLILREGDYQPVKAADEFMREIWIRRHPHGENIIDRSGNDI
ncbi:MAG TPA: hypothetical protein VFF50_06990 [Candidatus Deferrimicrobiaceae bacterium]|nr:hypothetical protein [Candidatus Deferrimicrobiaceae bacterium]